MIRYFSKIAFRYLLSNKTYSLLNYFCLTFGLTCAIIAGLYVRHIIGFDRFHENYDHLYAVESMVTFFNGDRFPKQMLSASLPDELKKNAPEIKEITRVADRNCTLHNGDKNFDAQGIFADENFFDVFSFSLVNGNCNQVLKKLNSVVISDQIAFILFGNLDCMGKTIVVKNDSISESYEISGIFKKIPVQSSLRFDIVIPFSKYLSSNTWALDKGATSNFTWVLLNNNTTPAVVNSKIHNILNDQEANLNQQLFLFPLRDKILYAYSGEKRIWRGMQQVVIVGTVGLVILLIACFNFINLAIAVNMRRHREAGIKKVIGSKKRLIIAQFMGETFIIITAGLISAMFLVTMLLPFLNGALNANMQLQLSQSSVIIFLLTIMLFTGLVSGLLPSIYLASSNPVNILKGTVISKKSFSIFRQSLIVFQFVIPVALIICVLIIRTQDSFMRNYDLGVERKKVIVVNTNERFTAHSEAIKAEVLGIPGIEAASFSNCIPSRGTQVSDEVTWNGKDAAEKIHFWLVNTDFDYNKTVSIRLTQGRFFDQSYSSDSDCYVINDIAADVIGNKNPVGTTLTVEGKKGMIIGVFQKFHAVDLAGPYAPVIVRIKKGNMPYMLVKMSDTDFGSVAAKLTKVLTPYYQDAVVNPVLFNDLPSYSNLALPSRLLGVSFIIALLLACMGLYGLASFNAEIRTKEIGIRKTNGASTFKVMIMLTSDYLKWLLIALGFAAPVAFFLGKIFLSGFYFHSTMPVFAFITGPLIAFVVALLTVSIKTFRVANRNPVEALRYE